MIKQINSTLFYAHDLKETARFYEQLGFLVENAGDVVRVKIGGFKLKFIDENKTPIKNESGMKPKGLGVFTYVEVENIDAYFKSLKDKGVRTSSEPRNWPWGKREFVVKDPDGYKLVFYSLVE